MNRSDKQFAVAVFLGSMIWGTLDAQAPVPEPFNQVKARDIVRRHIQAIGGEQALRSVKDVYLVMTMQMTGSDAMIRIESWRRPPRHYSRSETPGIGVTELGFDVAELATAFA